MVEARRQVPQDINPHKDDSLSQRKAIALQKLDWVRNSRVENESWPTKSTNIVASSSTYLDLNLAHIGRLTYEILADFLTYATFVIHTKLLTMIFEAPAPSAGPLGTTCRPAPRAFLVVTWFFLMPPTGGATFRLLALVFRLATRPPRRAE